MYYISVVLCGLLICADLESVGRLQLCEHISHVTVITCRDISIEVSALMIIDVPPIHAACNRGDAQETPVS